MTGPAPRAGGLRSPAVARRLADRLLRTVARLVVAGFFRDVEVHGDAGRPGLPTLVVANHFNGFVDPLVLARSLPRMPRFLGKATLWKVVAARPFLAVAGAIPVHRRVDEADTSGNASSFAACHRALADGELVAIFPEGTTHDEAHLATVRTGAARIALGAVAAGVTDLRILPVGLTFEDKIALRSRVLVRIGAPIELGADAAPFVAEATAPSEDDHDAVHRLTEEITDRLRSVAPDYESRHEQGALDLAAAVALRPHGARRSEAVALDEREDLAARLGRLPADERTALVLAVAQYHLDLHLLGVTDEDLVADASSRRLLSRLLLRAAAVVALGLFALGAVLVNLIPYAAVRTASRAVAAPVTKGTVRVLVAVVTFPLTWGVAAWLSVGWGWDWLGIVAALAVVAFLAVWVLEQAMAALRELSGLRNLRDRRGFAGPVLEHRERLVAQVLTATPTR